VVLAEADLAAARVGEDSRNKVEGREDSRHREVVRRWDQAAASGDRVADNGGKVAVVSGDKVVDSGAREVVDSGAREAGDSGGRVVVDNGDREAADSGGRVEVSGDRVAGMTTMNGRPSGRARE
jgi:hypothetical protein